MLSYTGEEHNLKRRPNRIDLSIRMQEFFDHYLKDSPMPPWMENGVPAIERNKINGWELLKN